MTSRGYKAMVKGFLSVFLIFTIGIPVIVASCPMAKSPGKISCAACLPSGDDTRPSIAPERNTSCCRTVIASGRNLIEYISVEGASNLDHFRVNAHAHVSIPSDVAFEEQALLQLRPTQIPLPDQGDIRLLVSSLLI